MVGLMFVSSFYSLFLLLVILADIRRRCFAVTGRRLKFLTSIVVVIRCEFPKFVLAPLPWTTGLSCAL